MKNYTFFLTIVVIFNYLVCNVLADNNYYFVSIRRSSKDKEYDKASEKVQNDIDKLVNDRMNDIYDIIADNKETYVTEDGKIDEKLEELEVTSQLRKRSENESIKNKKIMYQFVNRNRPQRHGHKNKINSINQEIVEYIPIESNLVIHICPVLNYYVVIAYLSDNLVNEIKALPNVLSCTKSKKLMNDHAINYNLNETSSPNYYNEEKILNETQWKGMSVKEHEFDFELRNTHLSLLSQGKYDKSSNYTYDNNYYYPSSAGKGVDIYVIDDGLDTSFSEENFDTYEGTPDERIIKCDGIFYDGINHPVSDERNCNTDYENLDEINHGTLVAISALGSINGAARKANLHMLAIDYNNYDVLTSFDYIKQNAKPHNTIVNISSGCYEYEEDCYPKEIQDKITELVEYGIIIFVSAGNTRTNTCQSRVYASRTGVIPIGALNNKSLNDRGNMEELYEIAAYSSYGECVELFAPGTIRVTNSTSDEILYKSSGTSFATPIAAGLASTIMAENRDIEFDFESMKKFLIDLSLKDAISGLEGKNTPNRIINNGKRSIYGSPKCNPSEENACQNENECCSGYGICINPELNKDLKYMCYF